MILQLNPRSGHVANDRISFSEVLLDIALLLAPLLAGWFVLAGDVDFPVHDDALAARSVENWLDTGSLHISSFATPSWVSQLAWGAVFCLVFGFSFQSLRLSVLVLTALGVACTYL